jgi:hypothetical protein
MSKPHSFLMCLEDKKYSEMNNTKNVLDLFSSQFYHKLNFCLIFWFPVTTEKNYG